MSYLATSALTLASLLGTPAYAMTQGADLPDAAAPAVLDEPASEAPENPAPDGLDKSDPEALDGPISSEGESQSSASDGERLATPRDGRTPLPNNAVYIEGLGAGFLYGFNYERLLPYDLALRVGFGYLGIGMSVYDAEANTTTNTNVGFFSVPITASYLGLRSDSGVHIFELGLGVTIAGLSASADVDIPLVGSLFHESVMTAAPHLVIGYRVQLGFFQLRGGLTPLLVFVDGDVGVIPMPHLSMGVSF